MGKSYSTRRVTIRLFCSMRLHVIGKDIGLGKSLSAHLATISFILQCAFTCAWSSGWNGKFFFHTPGNQKVFPRYVFACAWSGCWDQKIFFHTPGNKKVFLQWYGMV